MEQGENIFFHICHVSWQSWERKNQTVLISVQTLIPFLPICVWKFNYVIKIVQVYLLQVRIELRNYFGVTKWVQVRLTKDYCGIASKAKPKPHRLLRGCPKHLIGQFPFYHAFLNSSWGLRSTLRMMVIFDSALTVTRQITQVSPWCLGGPRWSSPIGSELPTDALILSERAAQGSRRARKC